MANPLVNLSDLQSGRSSYTVQVRLLHFWEARNVCSVPRLELFPKKSYTAALCAISITAAGTGITVLFSVICSLASSRVMAFKLAMRTRVISVEAKANQYFIF
ncbi:hypothetical protein IGI04_006776 [Brassica rapa subsp. trilocularis]|uniref:Uncharacterized protein n=1 Tax=Brassica rapa subsp. trilocularis TaxID=1813537 RepID=A0ABQ7NHU4_BRACM|nr:hypothetical protein IGI04_006776 [Brassica rapa subsp. trilocularis]